MADGWFLVDTVGETPAVLLIGSRTKPWRPLSNEFRGSVHKIVLRLVETVINNLKQSQVLIDLAGPRLALASPVLGPSRQVHGVLMWIGEPTQTPPAEPAARAWEWDLDDRVSPVLASDCRHAGIATLTDWLSGFARPADAVRISREIRTATVGFLSTGEWIGSDGTVHRYAHRCAATFAGPRMIGVSVQLPGRLDIDDSDLISRRIIDATAAIAEWSPALVDAETHRVIAWLSSSRPQLPPGVLAGVHPAPQPAMSQPWEGSPEMILGFYSALAGTRPG